MSKIREARIKAGLTQQEMSDRFGIPKRTIENWEAEVRTPPGYVEALVVAELERIGQEHEGKYYLVNFDARMGGDFCEIYDEDLNFVRSVRGVTSVPGLARITKRTSPVSAFLETEPLNDQFDLVVGRRKLSQEQIDKYDKNIIISREQYEQMQAIIAEKEEKKKREQEE